MSNWQMISLNAKRTLSILLIATLAACGGDATLGGGNDDGGGDDGGSTIVNVDAVVLDADSLELPSDAGEADEGITITLVATDASNRVVEGAAVSFSSTSGQIQALSTTTDSSGRAQAILTTAGNSTLRSITVAASAAGVGATLEIQVVAPSTTNDPVYRAGILQGDTFTNGQILITAEGSLSAGGSSGLRLDIVDAANGNTPYTGTASVQFISQCISQGISSVDPNPADAFNGTVSATYVALGCSGDDVLTAQVTVDGTALTATGTINVLPATIGSIEFVSASPTTIGIAGSGQPETSTVQFKVLNASGGPVVDQLVTFTLNSSAGGINLTPTQGTTNTEGVVQTVVKSGTVNTAVRVTARTTQDDITLTSQSELLVVSTGLPDQNSFSATAECFNVEGLNYDGVTSQINLLAADRFNNPVPDGTGISFVTEGGAVGPSCVTADGGCTVEWRSQDPRPQSYTQYLGVLDDGYDAVDGVVLTNGPRAGRSTVLITAIGEESFVDLDGDGRFDDGEPFGDLAEAFRDDNGSGAYEQIDTGSGFPGEEFVDFNVNGVRDAAGGSFTGFLCDGPAECDAAANSLTVRDSVTIVMSGSNPVVVPLRDLFVSNAAFDESGFEMVAGDVAVLRAVIRDVNYQPMPAETDVSVTQDGDAGDFVGTTSFIVPCTTDDSLAGNTYGFAYKSEAIDDEDVSSASSAIELSVQTPRGLNTIFGFSVVARKGPFAALRAVNRQVSTGDTVRFSWVSADVGSCSLSGATLNSSVSTSGVLDYVVPAGLSGTQTVTLSCEDDEDNTLTDSVVISVSS